MKILILASKPPWPPHDGGAIATLRCIEGLAQNGASVSVLAMRTQKHGSSDSVAPGSVIAPENYRSVSIDTSVKALSLISNLLFSDAPYDLARFRSPGFSGTLQKTIKEGSFDLIQCEGLLFSEYLEEIRALTSAPVVLRAHNVEHRIREMTANQTDRIIERMYLKNLAARLKRRETDAPNLFDAVVPISGPDMEWFTAAAPGKPMIQIESGVDIETAQDYADTDCRRVGFIGSLDWRPNAEGLIWFLKQVWPYVSKRMPAASLHIAGRNAPEKVRKQLTGRNVFFEGELPDARSFTLSMSVMIAPLFAGSGMRIKILEAMSLGKAVVATPVAAKGMPVTDRRDIMIASDQFMFSSALIELLGRPDLREQVSSAACRLVKERFDNSKLTLKLLSFYKELIRGR